MNRIHNLIALDPDELPQRLRAAGLDDPEVRRAVGSFRFRARKPKSAG
ncbi:MAG TPA: hypothetical protein VMU90_07210 [Solirubrobacteraceae bacterium]|nr:hypothetical protein [Solirubrobacteraceae bacterium]